jgi:hypothetical protein
MDLEAEREMWDTIVSNDRRSTYGAVETNSLTEGQREFQMSATEVVDLSSKRLERITRLRLVTDRDFPFWDLSYCYGITTDGKAVRVRLQTWQFSKADLNGDLIRMCKAAGRYGKALGIFDPEVVSKFYG